MNVHAFYTFLSNATWVLVSKTVKTIILCVYSETFIGLCCIVVLSYRLAYFQNLDTFIIQGYDHQWCLSSYVVWQPELFPWKGLMDHCQPKQHVGFVNHKNIVLRKYKLTSDFDENGVDANKIKHTISC